MPEMTAEDAVALLPRDAFILLPAEPGAPQQLLKALARRMPELGEPTMVVGDLAGTYDFVHEIPDSCAGRLTLLVGGGAVPTAEHVRAKVKVDWLPLSLHELTLALNAGRWQIDACLLTGTPPDHTGVVTLSPCVAYLQEASMRAGLVVMECSEGLPRLKGDTELPAETVSAYVRTDALPEVVLPPPTDVHRAVAGHLKDLIEDGSCLQVGVGGIADALLQSLDRHSDLTLHSGFLSDAILPLISEGVINGAGHPDYPGESVITGLLGTRTLYEFVDRNPAVQARSPRYLNDPAVIARLPKFVAVNSALELDLLGQVNAESIGGEVRFTGSGQIDFMRAAHRAPAGKSVIALASTTTDGARSRVVSRASDGWIVTTHRNDIDFVVTEHGIADLRDATLGERAARLIAVADPKFRDELQEQHQKRMGCESET